MRSKYLLRLACAGALAAALALAGCRKSEEAKPLKGELPVEQTPVNSTYEEQPGVLYERPDRTPTVSPAPAVKPSPGGTNLR